MDEQKEAQNFKPGSMRVRLAHHTQHVPPIRALPLPTWVYIPISLPPPPTLISQVELRATVNDERSVVMEVQGNDSLGDVLEKLKVGPIS